MLVYEYDRIEVDHCLRCGGTWLDKGELELLGAAALTLRRQKHNSKHRCPICDRAMDKGVVDVGSEIVLDQCPKGDGFWFDKGELKSILERGSKGDKIASFLSEVFRDSPGTVPVD